MDYVLLSIFGAITGAISMVLVYSYLYFLYRERDMGIWVISMLIFVSRLIIFDSELFDMRASDLNFTIYQILTVGATLTLMWGAHIFVNKPMRKCWLYGATGTLIVSYIFTLLHFPIFYKLLPPIWFCGIILIWIGVVFIRYLQTNKVGKLIMGYSYIAWGIHTLDIPFLIDVDWFTPWSFLIGGFLRIIISFGVLVLYFENTRLELISREAFRLLTENAVDVIYRYRLLPEAKFEYISPSVIEVTGYTPEEYYADAKLFARLVHYEDLFIFRKHTDNAWTNDLPLEYRLIHKDKRTVWIEQKFHPIYDEAGKLMIREGILRDVTARKYIEQIETQFDRMNMVGEMAVTVAHEVCNPLTTIRGYLQFSKGKKNICKERFDLMIEELDRINSIINEYLLLAQNKRVHLKSCCLNSIIHKLLPLIKTYTIASGTSIKLELGNIPEILIDENEIRFLVLNLVRNGVEAMPLGGELTICTAIEQEQIVLEIKDQGIGIATYIVEELGTPFVTTKDTGTGLGLPTCYRIAERHNATIDFKTGNQGTTFFVYFNSNLVA